MLAVKLTIHRGAKQVGGTCVEVATDRTRVILDVGSPLADPATLLEGNRPSNQPELPDVPGLFSDGPRVDAVVLSHAHSDHTGLIEKVRPIIPVYLSSGTSKMLMAGSMFAGQPRLDRKRERKLLPLKPTLIGDITITAFPVDHSAYDSMALMVEADGKRLLYSGDLRLHGRMVGRAKQLIEAATATPLDVLLMEGTNLSRRDQRTGHTEQELEDFLLDAIREAPGLVLANFSPLHVERMVSFCNATSRAGRKFVVDVYGALVRHLVSRGWQGMRSPGFGGFRVYYPRSFERTWRRRNLGDIHEKFLAKRIEIDEVEAKPQEFVMLFRPSMLAGDFKNRFLPGTRCIYSYWPGYLAQPEYRLVEHKLHEAQGDLVELHTSGHLFVHDLVEFVRAVNPCKVVPIHTNAPWRFSELFENALLLSDGITLIL